MVKFYKGSKSVLSDIIAIIIVLFPIAAELFNSDIFIPIASAALLTACLWRSCEKGYIDLSLFMLAPFSLLAYSVITLFFAANKSGHIYYMISLFALLSISALTADYINEKTISEAKRKITYMLSVSVLFFGVFQITGIVLSLVLFINQPAKSSCAAFMAILSAILQLRSSYERIKKRDGRILFFLAASIIVFIINCSLISFIAVCALFAILIFNIKKKPLFTVMTAALAAFLMFLSQNKELSKAAFMALKSNPFGMGGGGFLSAIQMYSPEFSGGSGQIGAFFYLITSAGIVGLAVNVIILLWLIILHIRTKSFASALSLICTVFFMADSVSFFKASLLAIIITFNDSDIRMTETLKINEKRKTEFVCGVCSVTVIMMIISLLSCVRIYGENLYRQKKYDRAEIALKTVSTINVTDSESLRFLALTISAKNPKDWKKASEILNRAQKRDRNNSEIRAAQASVLYNGKQYKASAQNWESAISMAPFNNDYKISYANALYKWIQQEEYGSGESKRLYGMISSLAETVKDLETKKIINNFADKALEYTREKTLINGEMIYEGSSSEG